MHPLLSRLDPILYSCVVEGSLTLPGEQCGGGDDISGKLLGSVMIFLIVDSGISASASCVEGDKN